MLLETAAITLGTTALVSSVAPMQRLIAEQRKRIAEKTQTSEIGRNLDRVASAYYGLSGFILGLPYAVNRLGELGIRSAQYAAGQEAALNENPIFDNVLKTENTPKVVKRSNRIATVMAAAGSVIATGTLAIGVAPVTSVLVGSAAAGLTVGSISSALINMQRKRKRENWDRRNGKPKPNSETRMIIDNLFGRPEENQLKVQAVKNAPKAAEPPPKPATVAGKGKDDPKEVAGKMLKLVEGRSEKEKEKIFKEFAEQAQPAA